MPKEDLPEFDLTVRKVLTRNLETDEEETGWRVESENLDRPCAGDTAKEALEVFAACLETDNEQARISVEDLEAEDDDLLA